MIKIEIGKERIETANELKKAFGEVHKKIKLVEEKMNEINQESALLIDELTNLRRIESDFINDLLEEHGTGKLDPFELKWIKEQ